MVGSAASQLAADRPFFLRRDNLADDLETVVHMRDVTKRFGEVAWWRLRRLMARE